MITGTGTWCDSFIHPWFIQLRMVASSMAKHSDTCLPSQFAARLDHCQTSSSDFQHFCFAGNDTMHEHIWHMILWSSLHIERCKLICLITMQCASHNCAADGRLWLRLWLPVAYDLPMAMACHAQYFFCPNSLQRWSVSIDSDILISMEVYN